MSLLNELISCPKKKKTYLSYSQRHLHLPIPSLPFRSPHSLSLLLQDTAGTSLSLSHPGPHRGKSILLRVPSFARGDVRDLLDPSLDSATPSKPDRGRSFREGDRFSRAGGDSGLDDDILASGVGTPVAEDRPTFSARVRETAEDVYDFAVDVAWRGWDVVQDVAADVIEEVGRMRPRERCLLALGILLAVQALFVLRYVFWAQPRSYRQVAAQMVAMQAQLAGVQQDLRRTLDLMSVMLLDRDQLGRLQAMANAVKGASEEGFGTVGQGS